MVARRICTTYVNPQGLAPLLASRLIALDKYPGVRPIGVGETARRIISKTILSIVGSDIKEATGSYQLCAGHESGCEAAVHSIFHHTETEAILQVDASNAFNSLNRQAALLIIQSLCPSFATVLINTYREGSELFIDGESIPSHEGTTQGDPLAMGMYALGTLPLIHKLNQQAHQVWYADGASAGGKLQQLRAWWDGLTSLGPAFSYFANPHKTWLIVKRDHLEAATEIFHGTGVKVTIEGKRHLGAAIGERSFVDAFVGEKVAQWVQELEELTAIARTHPQAAYAALTHGFMGKWSYAIRTIPNISDSLQPLEAAIRHQLLPALTGGTAISDLERELFALPTHLGGLGIQKPTERAHAEFSASCRITASIVERIVHQLYLYDSSILEDQHLEKAKVKAERRATHATSVNNLYQQLPSHLCRALDIAKEKGSSNWLAVLPIASHGFSLHKGTFRDALCLRCGWQPQLLPTTCTCGQSFTIDHAVCCSTGGFPTVHHNELRDLTASLLSEVFHDVCVEPSLQPLTGETLLLYCKHRSRSTA